MLLEEDKDGALSQEIRPFQNFNDRDIFLTVSRSILFFELSTLRGSWPTNDISIFNAITEQCFLLVWFWAKVVFFVFRDGQLPMMNYGVNEMNIYRLRCYLLINLLVLIILL